MGIELTKYGSSLHYRHGTVIAPVRSCLLEDGNLFIRPKQNKQFKRPVNDTKNITIKNNSYTLINVGVNTGYAQPDLVLRKASPPFCLTWEFMNASLKIQKIKTMKQVNNLISKASQHDDMYKKAGLKLRSSLNSTEAATVAAASL